MDFLKKLRKSHKPDREKDLEGKPEHELVNSNNESCRDGRDDLSKLSPNPEPVTDIEDDDDDFITNEVKRRLKELRRNSFMVLIPEEEEEAYMEEEDAEEGETNTTEWRDVEAEGRQWWVGFDVVYDKYCEHMLFFDRMSSHQLKEAGVQVPSTPSPRSASKKLTSPLRCLSLKKFEEPEEETEHLQQQDTDPYYDLETAYVAHICLTWEALHCQYTQLSQLISCQPDNSNCYSHSAQQFQQFQVLLQRFVENEAFEEGRRAEIYTRARNLLPKLLQVPKIQGSDKKEMTEEEAELMVRTSDLIRVIQSSILTFHSFLKMEKKKPNGVLNLFSNQNQMATPLQQVQFSLEKKKIKLKEVQKKTKKWKNKSWPQTREDVQLLFSLIDVKVMSRVVRMTKISKEQLFWCEEKMKKLDLCNGKLKRDPTPILFPC